MTLTVSRTLLALLAVLLTAAPVLAQQAAPLSPNAAHLMQTYYGAFRPGADAPAAIRAVTSDTWISCANNDQCLEREPLLHMLGGFRQAIPDLQWRIVEYIEAGDRIIARGEGTGTPAGDFLGVPHQGRSFRVSSIDIHTVMDGRIIRTFHLEDWASAIRQLSGH